VTNNDLLLRSLTSSPGFARLPARPEVPLAAGDGASGSPTKPPEFPWAETSGSTGWLALPQTAEPDVFDPGTGGRDGRERTSGPPPTALLMGSYVHLPHFRDPPEANAGTVMEHAAVAHTGPGEDYTYWLDRR
jgi:hypothetical protein